MRTFILAPLLLAVAAAPAFAQAPAAAPVAAPAPVEDMVPVALETSLGRIVIALDRGRAPLTTANFLRYVDSHRFDGQNFYRTMHSPDGKGGDGGLIQGGITTDARKLFPAIAHEPTSQTGIKNTAGSVSMANAGPGTAKSDFFILLSDMPGLDAGGPGGDANGFAAFGHVTEGMDVVKQIWNAPTSPTKGTGVMKGQMLEPQVKILKATRVK